MSKKIFVTILLVHCTIIAIACDICGSGAGSSYMGILPDFNAKIVGLRYRYNSLQTHVGPNGSSTYLTTPEAYHAMDIWAGWTFKERFRIMASLPISYNRKTKQSTEVSKSGLGDASLQAFYRLINSNTKIAKQRLLVQNLWLGAGIKMPTGKYEPKDKEGASKNANLFQLGTGSLDFNLLAMYDVRIQNIGLNLTGSYKINTTNIYAYYYGNKFSGNAQVYYRVNLKDKASVSPNIGLSFEQSSKDLDDGYSVFASGGQMVFATLGTELLYKKISIGGNYQHVLSQQLAHGIVSANNKLMLHVSFLF